MLLEWSEAYALGIPRIDVQHKQLVEMINNLHEAMMQGKGKDVLSDILAGLVRYTTVHFTTEEDVFAKGYADSAAHIEEHKNFVAKVTDFQQSFESGDAGLTMEILSFLKSWLVDHITGTDKKYVEFFHEQGL